MKRSPSSERVPWESLRWMTGPRSARSAALLVGLDALDGHERPERRPDLEQVVGEAPVQAGAFALACGVLEQFAQLGLDRRHLGREPGAVLVLTERAPDRKQPLGEHDARLRRRAFCSASPSEWRREISLEVLPARLAALGVEVVIGPPAVRADDPLEVLADQLLQAVAVAVLGDPEDRCAGVVAVHSVRASPAVCQPVSSRLTAGDASTAATSCSCGKASAAAAR